MPGSVAYQTYDEFLARTTMPASFVAEVEARTPGWIAIRLLINSANIDARLCKRYDAPFTAPAPLIVCDWLTRIVTLETWLKRGVSATDEQFLEYKQQATEAAADIKEAADSNTGLFNLPLRADTDESGVTRGYVLSSSQASPYAWMDDQVRDGRAEDGGRR